MRLGLSLRVLMLALLTSLLTTVAAGSASAGGDRDCGDFATQRAAQIFFLNHGGPQSDPHGLDADGDGIACESNPCPCLNSTHPPGGGGGGPTPPPPRPPVQSDVSLSANRSKGITGEAVKLRAVVSPHIARPVVLQRRVDGHWAKVASARTNGQGVHVFAREVAAKTIVYRAVISTMRHDGRRYTGGMSGPESVGVQDQSVVLTLPDTVETNEIFTAVADASPVRNGRGITLQQRVDQSWADIAVDDENGQGHASYDVSILQEGTFRFRAVVERQAGADAVVSATQTITVVPPPDTTAPGVPIGLAASPGDGSASLTWDAVVAGDLAGYRVYQGASATGPWTLVRDEVSDPAATVSGLTNGTTYWFAVSSVDASGNESALSTPASVTPVAPDPGR